MTAYKKLPLYLMSLLSFVSGCKNSNTPAKKQSQSLQLYLQNEPMSLDPRIGGTRNAQAVVRELFEPLMRINKEGVPVPAMAEHVEVSADGLTYRFFLKNSLWSTGEPVTAYDFEYAWKSILSPQFPSNYAFAFYQIKGAKEAKNGKIALDAVGIKAIDDKTLEVVLDYPAPYFLELTANALYSPVHKKIVEKDADWNRNAGPQFATNGPFTLASWKHQSEIKLEKNKLYRESNLIAINAISFSIIEDPQTALDLFNNKELDWVGEPFGSLPLEAMSSLKQQKMLETIDVGGVHWIETNTKNPLLSSLKIRKALAMAINRQDLTDNLLQGGETPIYSMLPKILSQNEKPLFKDNASNDASILFQEGLQELGLTAQTMPPLIISSTADPREKAVASSIQQQLAQALNIPVSVNICDQNTLFSKTVSGDYQMALSWWFTWYQDPIYNLALMRYTDNGMNGTGWENKRYNELLDLSNYELDPLKRKMLLAEAEEILMQEMPLIPLYNHTYKFCRNPQLKGTYLTPVGMLDLKEAVFE